MINLKPFTKSLNNRPLGVFGLARSGLSTLRALAAAGVKTYAWDDNEKARAQAVVLGAEVIPLTQGLLQNCAALVLAPGVPLYFPTPHPVVRAAQAAGIEIIGDLEILHRAAHGFKTIGITGTNGKSTTTALIAHILNAGGYKSAMGGNIGAPVLNLDPPAQNGAFVLEVSSYQLDLSPTFRPDIAALLNITPDHIDRHGSFENYIAAKEAIFEGEGIAIIGIDDEPCAQMYKRLLKHSKRKIIPVSCAQVLQKGLYIQNGELYDDQKHVGSLNGLPTLRGVHNHQNAAIAYAVCKKMGLAPREIIEHMQSFPGLAHRQFCTRVINGVSYINDSKATNAEAAAKALAAYTNIFWIAGGLPKEGGLQGLENLMTGVREAFLIGEAAAQFGQWLSSQKIPYQNCETLEKAVAAAHFSAQNYTAKTGEARTVMLSPACASFDQFQSYEHRGEAFERIVSLLGES